jgi:altronate dehydratase small subunit
MRIDNARLTALGDKHMSRGIVLHPEDDVATIVGPARKGDRVALSGEGSGAIELREDVPYGHKCAIRAIRRHAQIRKYGQVIGRATADIAAGDHVHVHNVEALRARGDIGPGA